MTTRLISVVVPVRNEHQNIGRCLEGLATALANDVHEILVVYDSDDDTTLAAIDGMQPKPATVRLVKNHLGPSPSLAIRAGLDASNGDAIVVTMADLSDPPEAIHRLVEKVRAGADVVSGSRYMRGGRQVGGPPLKTLLSRAAGLSLAWVAGVHTHDATTSFRAFSRRFIGQVPLESRTGFTFGLEAVVKAHREGLVVDEVPVTWSDRTAGRSNFRVAQWLGAYLHWYARGMTEPLLVWGLWLGASVTAAVHAARGRGSLLGLASIAVFVLIIAARRLRGRMSVIDGLMPLSLLGSLLGVLPDGVSGLLSVAIVSAACLALARALHRRSSLPTDWASLPGPRWMRWVAPASALAASAAVQSAVFQHELRGDDYLHLFAVVHTGWKAIFAPYAGHVIPLHKLAYALLWRAFGVWSGPYFGLALLTHLACVFLLYRLVLRLSGSRIWSAIWATAWGSSLICQSTMNMFACYGGVLCTVPALWVTEDVLHASDDGELPSVGRVLVWSTALLLCALSFGVGIGAVLAMPLMLALAYFQKRPVAAALRFLPTTLGVLLLYSYIRSRTGEQVPFAPWVLPMLPPVIGGLYAYGFASLLLAPYLTIHGGHVLMGPLVPYGEGVLMVATALVGILASAALVFGFRASRSQAHRWLSVLVIPILSYSLIAVGRIVVMLTLGATLYLLIYATRYHYFASSFLAAGLAGALAALPAVRDFLQRPAVGWALLAWLGLVLVPAWSAARKYDVASSDVARYGWRFVDDAVEAAAARQRGNPVYVFNELFPPTQGPLRPPDADFPHIAAAWAISRRAATRDGRAVRFVERDSGLLATMRSSRESPMGRLMVSRAEAGPDFKLRSGFAITDPAAVGQEVAGIYPRGGNPWSWTDQRFTIELARPPGARDRGALLRIDEAVPDPEIAQLHSIELRVRAGGIELPVRTLTSAGRRVLEIPVPSLALQRDEISLEFSLDKYFAAPGDTRHLGLIVSRFDLVSR